MGNTATSKEEENVEEQEEEEEETTTSGPTDDATTNGKKRPLDESNNDDNGGDSGMNDKSLEKKQKHASAGDSAEAAASKVVDGTAPGGEDGTPNVDRTEQASKTATESTPTTTATTTAEPAKPAEVATGATKPGVEDDVMMIPPGTVGIDVYNEFDVLSGRGGGTNVHGGNRDFRDMINKNRTRYLRAKKNDKPAISRSIVKEIRSRGGRFLKLNKDKLWYEIGDDQAREKTSQCLRQKAPEIRKLMFEASQQQATDATAVGATTNTTTGAAAGTGMNGTPGAHVNTGVSVGATNPAALPPGVASVLGQPSVMPMGLPFGVMAQAQYQQQLLAMHSMNQQACMMHPAMMMANGGGGGGGVVAMTNPMLLQTMMANSAVPGLPPVRGGMAPGPMMYNNMPPQQGVANVGNQTTLSNVTPGWPGPGPANQPNGPGQKKQNAEL